MNYNNDAVRIMTEFVEGKISVADFKIEFDYNPDIERALLNDPKCPQRTSYLHSGEGNIVRFLKSQNWLSASGQLNISGEISRFLLRYDYPFIPTDQYSERFKFLLDVQPSWLDILDEKFLDNNIIAKIPKEIKSKTGKIKWSKNKLKELFTYETTYPRWIQSPEWPIKDGVPLHFVRQSKNKEITQFHFINKSTNEEVVIEQFT